MLKATIIVPTTGDRGPLLPYSVGSILGQSLEELEVFIIGDGVSSATRAQIQELQASDARIRFFDHPKHPRRGEVYRHQALQEAKGEIVAYLCDRDLLLPNHLEELYQHLQSYPMAAVNFYRVARDQSIGFGKSIPFFGPSELQPAKRVQGGEFVLSSVGHRLDFYRQLPYGWRTTPAQYFTDRYMWQQMLSHPKGKLFSSTTPTFLYFKRGHFPGWPLEKRLPELRDWSQRLAEAPATTMLQQEATEQLLREQLQQRQLLSSKLLINGDQPATILRRLQRKAATLPKRLLARLRS